MQITTVYLITKGLGYCCEWFFWSQFRGKSNQLIADRLGISPRTVKEHKAAFRRGEVWCACVESCMKKRLFTSRSCKPY
jgi:hypothetical protein